MKELRIISVMVFMLSLASCYYDVEELLYPNTECATEMMSYSIDIAPILVDNCYTCHNAQAKFGNVIVDSHVELIKYTTSNELLGVIKHSPGFSAMPQSGPKLLDCQIGKIEAWINQGALNN